MRTDRILRDAAFRETLASHSGPTIALWLDCVIAPALWHIGVIVREGHETLAIDQTDRGLRVRGDLEPRGYWWVIVHATRTRLARLRVAAQRLRIIGTRPPETRLPFDHVYLGGIFDTAGRYVPASGERGLNCASVVLAVFEGVAYPLVDRASFAGRRLSADELAALLGEADAEHHDRIGASQDAVFLPTEVAGACLFELPRVPLAQASAGAAHFVELAAKRAAG